MPTTHYICWVDDRPKTLQSYDDYLDVLNDEHDCLFDIDPHYDTDNLDIIARNIDENLIFFIDNNLKRNDGSGIDGPEVIAMIRQHNQSCPIVFYSSKATQEELKELVKEHVNVVCVIREQLKGVLKDIADGSFSV